MAWDKRVVHWDHLRQYRRSVELHSLTRAWIAEFDTDGSAGGASGHRLSRGIAKDPSLTPALVAALEQLPARLTAPSTPDDANPDRVTIGNERAPGTQTTATLAGIDRALEASLEAQLNDTSVEDVILRVHEAVLLLRRVVVRRALELAGDRAEIALNRLGQCAWRQGRSRALEHWPEFAAQPLQDVVATLQVVASVPLEFALCIERQTPQHARLRRVNAGPPVGGESEAEFEQSLEQLELEWLRGYCYVIAPSLQLRRVRRDEWEMLPAESRV